MAWSGLYGIIQYADRPERFEFANVGVVLFSERSPKLIVRVVDGPRRVHRMLGSQRRLHFKDDLQSFVDRLALEFAGGWDRRDVQSFSDQRSGQFRLSPLRSILLHPEHEDQIAELFGELVSDDPNAMDRMPQARHRLARRFKALEVDHLLERPSALELPQGVTINAPYGYQNGSYNYISAVSLRGNPDEAIKNAGGSAWRGQLLSSLGRVEGRRLVVVGDVEGQQDNFVSAVSDLMEQNEVRFYAMTLDDLEPLAADIRENYKKHTREAAH